MTRSCPDCGADLYDGMIVEKRLSALGYKHRDTTVECPDCPWQGHFGHPVDPETDEPPRCEVCGGRTYPYKLDFHRVADHLDRIHEDGGSLGPGAVQAIARDLDVHWKCERCHYRPNDELEHLTADVYSLGISHLEGRRDDA